METRNFLVKITDKNCKNIEDSGIEGIIQEFEGENTIKEKEFIMVPLSRP